MVEKNKDKPIIEIKGNTPEIKPLFSNVFGLSTDKDIVIINFGLISHSYNEPYDLEDLQIANICLPWDTVEELAKILKEALADHKREFSPKRPAKVKPIGK